MVEKVWRATAELAFLWGIASDVDISDVYLKTVASDMNRMLKEVSL